MKLKTLLIIATVIFIPFGVGLLIAAGPLMSFYGLMLDQDANVVAQIFGAALIGYCAMNWTARNASSSESQRAIVLNNFLFHVIALFPAFFATVSGVLNGLGWSSVIIHVFLAGGFGYFLFTKPSEA